MQYSEKQCKTVLTRETELMLNLLLKKNSYLNRLMYHKNIQ